MNPPNPPTTTERVIVHPMDLSQDPGPIRSRNELEAAPLERIEEHIRWELRRLVGVGTQEFFAIEVLNYPTAAQLNKILHGKAQLPIERARLLDAAAHSTSLEGTTFEDLVRVRATRQRRRAPNGSGIWDVFLALPMASTDDHGAFRRVQEGAALLVETLQNHCGFSVYCGATQVKDRDDFDSPAFALAENVDALRTARHFLLWVDKPLSKPSSVWVEAGMALVMGKPSVYMVPGPDVLPYILRQATNSGISALGQVRCEWLSDGNPAALVRRHGTKLFKG